MDETVALGLRIVGAVAGVGLAALGFAGFFAAYLMQPRSKRNKREVLIAAVVAAAVATGAVIAAVTI